jgi:hypothetical protein
MSCICIREIVCYKRIKTEQLEKIQNSTNIIHAEGLISIVSFAELMLLKSVVNSGVILYSKLLSQQKKLEKIQQFKSELRAFLLQHAFYSTDEYRSYYLVHYAAYICIFGKISFSYIRCFYQESVDCFYT